MATPVQVRVTGFGGPKCTVEAFSDWTIQQVQDMIFRKIGVPAGRQILLKGCEELAPQAVLHTVASVSDAPANVEVTLTLVVDEADPVKEEELRDAFKAVFETLTRNEEAVQKLLGLLSRRRVSGLDERVGSHVHTMMQGLTYLQCAAIAPCDLQDVGCAILARKDFSLVNAKGCGGDNLYLREFRWGMYRDATALHIAAMRGRTKLCKAIIEREGFEELDARWSGLECAEANGFAPVDLPPGETATEVALRCGHDEIHQMLVAERAERDAGVKAD